MRFEDNLPGASILVLVCHIAGVLRLGYEILLEIEHVSLQIVVDDVDTQTIDKIA